MRALLGRSSGQQDIRTRLLGREAQVEMREFSPEQPYTEEQDRMISVAGSSRDMEMKHIAALKEVSQHLGGVIHRFKPLVDEPEYGTFQEPSIIQPREYSLRRSILRRLARIKDFFLLCVPSRQPRKPPELSMTLIVKPPFRPALPPQELAMTRQRQRCLPRRSRLLMLLLLAVGVGVLMAVLWHRSHNDRRDNQPTPSPLPPLSPSRWPGITSTCTPTMLITETLRPTFFWTPTLTATERATRSPTTTSVWTPTMTPSQTVTPPDTPTVMATSTLSATATPTATPTICIVDDRCLPPNDNPFCCELEPEDNCIHDICA